jgi:hypothetical protein
MSYYEDVLEDHNERLGFDPESPMESGNSDCNEGKHRSRNFHFKAKSGDNVRTKLIP